ncbi:MAG TPA: hypothetical protein VHN36_20140 [Ilumatobacteraceae bacterium]|nr:hypothetical protein [Ilumatobacteraceae bacterium]
MKWRHQAAVVLTAGAIVLAPLNAAEATSFGKPVATYFGSTPVFGPLVNALCSGLVTLANVAGTPINVSNSTSVTKTVTRSDNADGSTDFMVIISGPIPATFTSIDVLDCVWIDTNNDGVQQILTEPMRSYRALGVPIAGTGANRTVTFELNVPAAVGKPVCDRAFGVSWSSMQSLLSSPSGIASGSWLALYTPKACAGPTPPSDVPEVGLSVLLTISGVLTGAAVLHRQRRRRLAL